MSDWAIIGIEEKNHLLMHLFYYNICIYEIYLLILQKQLRIDAETSAEGQGVGEAKCS